MNRRKGPAANVAGDQMATSRAFILASTCLAALLGSACAGSKTDSSRTDEYTLAFCGFAVRCGLAPDAGWCARSTTPVARVDASIAAGRVRAKFRQDPSMLGVFRGGPVHCRPPFQTEPYGARAPVFSREPC
jgi:hypothetical protein